ncbi:capsid assembly protein [Achromobacter xylosoxidans]|uniref:capsid assembly protein n=1 Tax=Alcaligenes xylosoxydans xylosoxydans TaxID=85698 RepID=UPI0011777F05|nr:hypothetical protein [Achromobacter xylosoxidans]
MWIRGLMQRVMQEAGPDGGAGGGGTGADGSAGSDGAAGAGAAGSSADAGNAGAAPAAGSLLKQGEAGADPLPQEFIPEKYRVTKDGGDFDLEASARKLADAHGHLEKRLGTGDVPPKEAAEYKVAAPEAMADYNAGEDPAMQAFLADAHKAGLTQAQLDVVMKHHFEGAQKMAQGFQALDQQQATEQLQKVWGKSEAEFKRHAGLAYAAQQVAAEKAGLTFDEVDKALGNNPTFLRLMSALGSEFEEDAGPGKTSFRSLGEEGVQQLMLSDAYKNPRHPEHASVSERVKGYFERKHGKDAVA